MKRQQRVRLLLTVSNSLFPAAPPAADGAAADGAAAARFRTGGDQPGGSTRRQHGRHGGPPRQEEEDHPDRAEEVHQHHQHHLRQVNGEEVQQRNIQLLFSRTSERRQDVHIKQGDRRCLDQRIVLKKRRCVQAGFVVSTLIKQQWLVDAAVEGCGGGNWVGKTPNGKLRLDGAC